METEIGKAEVTYSARGIATYSLEMWHEGLNKHRIIKGAETYILEQKARIQMQEWDNRWATVSTKNLERQEKTLGKQLQEAKKQEAVDLTAAAAAEQALLAALLKATLEVDDKMNWENLKDKAPFPERQPSRPRIPQEPVPSTQSRKPEPEDGPYLPKLGLLDRLIPSRKVRILDECKAKYRSDLEDWQHEVREQRNDFDRRHAAYDQSVQTLNEQHQRNQTAWELRKTEYLKDQATGHDQIDAKRDSYLSKNPESIIEYCDLVLSNSAYPDYFPQEFDLDYIDTSNTLIVEYQLPSPEHIPTLKAVKYVATRDSMDESHITDVQKLKLYDDALYQVVLRTVHELFEADVIQKISAVVFNGIVTATDRTTGKEVTSCVLSLRAERDAFMEINLAQVDPKACFKSLKGVGSAKLSGLVSIAPIMKMTREDARFIAAYGVANTLDDSMNLASMDWGDFEHLIREVFEKEFSSTGGEVKVTQASRDGGVDAIAFDPDPIRGGKIVIQAKRWTNTVGVSAVRDLYGTVMAEGATKGVLVTTSDYGADSYAFANGKPLVLLNGSNLLHMLEKHGHRARINLREAKQQQMSG